ncbi:MAG: rhomboid family intramembrane serine protease [bacterium]|nr:rhomboid family intramembrane serine protease [bacterium]
MPASPRPGSITLSHHTQQQEVIHAESVEVLDSRGRPMAQPVRQWNSPVTFALIAANIIVYINYNVLLERVPHEWAFAPAYGQVFPQIITYMFTHGSIGHIFGNLMVIFFFGRVVEMIYGSWRYLVIYVLTGIAAALIQNAVAPAVLIGASGAASACMVIFVRHFPRAIVQLYFVLPMPAWFALALWVAFNILGTRFNVWGEQMAYVAHLAGLAAGLLLSLIALPPGRRGSRGASRSRGF